MNETQYRVVRTLKALGNPVRYQIFRQIGEHGKLSSSELAEWFGRDQANISYHLGKLRDADLISSHRDEAGPVYSIKRNDVLDFIASMEECFRR